MYKICSIQRFLIPLFIFVWWNRLFIEHPHHPDFKFMRKVVKVKGWRTALLDDSYSTSRSIVTFMFKWEDKLK